MINPLSAHDQPGCKRNHAYAGELLDFSQVLLDRRGVLMLEVTIKL